MGGPAFVGGKSVKSTDNFLVAPIKIRCVVVDSNDQHQEEQEIEWKTCEHFFQASKFDSQYGAAAWDHCRLIQESESAVGAWSLGQSRRHPLRSDWEAVKGHSMYLAVKAKYDQYPLYAAELVSTAGPINAASSTSNWQELNSMVLERVRFELAASTTVSPEEREQYDVWCQNTSLPTDSSPLVVYLSVSHQCSSNDQTENLSRDNRPSQTF